MEERVSLLLREDGFELGQRIAHDRAPRLNPGHADDTAEPERRFVSGADGGPPLVAAGDTDSHAVETGRGEPRDRRPSHLAAVTHQHALAAQPVVLDEGVLDPMLTRG